MWKLLKSVPRAAWICLFAFLTVGGCIFATCAPCREAKSAKAAECEKKGQILVDASCTLVTAGSTNPETGEESFLGICVVKTGHCSGGGPGGGEGPVDYFETMTSGL